MALPDTLLVDGVDLRTLTGIVVESMELFAPGRRRGGNDTIPGRRGQLGFGGVYDAYAFAVTVAVLPIDGAGVIANAPEARRTQMIANLRALAAALDGTDGLVTLTRRLASDGVGGYVVHTATGQYVDGLAIELLNADSGITELQFVNLDGCWFAAAAPTVPIVP